MNYAKTNTNGIFISYFSERIQGIFECRIFNQRVRIPSYWIASRTQSGLRRLNLWFASQSRYGSNRSPCREFRKTFWRGCEIGISSGKQQPETVKALRSKLKFLASAALLLAILVTGYNSPIFAAESGEVKTSGGSTVSRVAPGEFLPVSVKLANFGAGKRVDVTIDYQVLGEAGRVVLTESETVAVETTASYVKNIQIPQDLPPGNYTVTSGITYEGQEVPATAKFQFTVERKIAGIFISQLVLYGTITLVVGIVFAIISRLIIKRRFSRHTPHEYSHVPKHERPFYEIISDLIAQMRQHTGDRAIEIASNIDGLSIRENGKVLAINKDPTEIVALLVLQYEKSLGKEPSFSARKADEETKKALAPAEQNLGIVSKYFK